MRDEHERVVAQLRRLEEAKLRLELEVSELKEVRTYDRRRRSTNWESSDSDCRRRHSSTSRSRDSTAVARKGTRIDAKSAERFSMSERRKSVDRQIASAHRSASGQRKHGRSQARSGPQLGAEARSGHLASRSSSDGKGSGIVSSQGRIVS